jgi:cyanophycinase
VTMKRLLAIGGKEDKENESELLKQFVEMSGGESAELLVMTIATEEVSETVKEYRKVFRRLNAARAACGRAF